MSTTAASRYAQLPPPRRLGEPPPGMANKLVRHLVHCINEASTVIPGWDGVLLLMFCSL